MFGGDKNTYYVFLVGELLDLLNFQDLIPKIPQPSILIDRARLKQSPTDTTSEVSAEATSFAGYILEDVLKSVKAEPGPMINHYRVLKKVPESIIQKLMNMGYWDYFTSNLDIPGVASNIMVLPLPALREFRKAESKKGNPIGLGAVRKWYMFWRDDYRYFFIKDSTIWPVEDISRDEFRIIMIGIIADLFRIYAEAAADRKFWNKYSEYVQNLNSMTQ